MMRAAEATAIRPDIVWAAVVLKSASWCLKPAEMKQQPRTWESISRECNVAAGYSFNTSTYQKDVGENATEHTTLYNADLIVS